MSMQWMIHFCKFSFQKIYLVNLCLKLYQLYSVIIFYLFNFRVCRESDMDDEVTKIFKKWKLSNKSSLTEAGQISSYNLGTS